MSIISRSTSVRCGAAALAAGAALMAAGCGSSAPAAAHHHMVGRPAVARVGAHQLVSAASFTAVHSTQQVMRHFQAATGDTLTDQSSAVWDTLSMPATDMQAYDRYGTFTIYVLHNPQDLKVFTSQNGRPLVPDSHGIYWPVTADSSGYWNPAKVYGNVVLTWVTQSRTPGSQFRLLDAILSTLGKSAAAVNAQLPAADVACRARGITPTSGMEGTCSQDGVPTTVVNRNHTLHTSGYDARVIKTKSGNVISSAATFGPPLYAQGRFFLVTVLVRNDTNQPLEGLDGAELEVDGRYYDQNIDATVDLTPLNAFPVQPGEYGATNLVFDVPPAMAAAAASQGELVIPKDPEGMIGDGSPVGAIRLRAAAAEGSGSASRSGSGSGAPASSDSLVVPSA